MLHIYTTFRSFAFQLFRYRALFVALAFFVCFGGLAFGQEKKPLPESPYVPTNEKTVTLMLKLAKVRKNDVLYDLGSGDGRIVIAAVKDFGAKRGVGIEIDPELIKESNENARQAKVTDKVKFIEGDLFETDFSEATVVTLYLLPSVILSLRPKLLAQLKPGTRVVSHGFDMGDWKAEKTVEVEGTTLYLWTVPEKKNPKTKKLMLLKSRLKKTAFPTL